MITEAGFKDSFRKGTTYLMTAVAVLSITALIGWQFDIFVIKHPLPHLIAMNPISAVCFLAASISFFLLQKKQTAPIGYFVAGIPVVIGLLRLAELIGGLDFDLDVILFHEPFARELQTGLAAHIVSSTALCFIFLGFAIVLHNLSTYLAKRIATAFAMIISLLAIFSIMGYIFGVNQYFGFLSYVPMAIHTATGFLLVGLALIFISAEASPLRVIYSPYSGGTIARRLIPVAVIMPILLGYIRLQSQIRYPVSEELGISYLLTGLILILLTLIIFTSYTINIKDILQKKAEDELIAINNKLELRIAERTEELSRREQFYRALIENSADAIVLTDKDLITLFQSPGAERMTGISLERRKQYPGLRYSHPDDVSLLQIAVQQSYLSPGKPIPFKSRFLHLNGNYIWIEGTLTNLLEDKAVNALAFNYRDVTERQLLEERKQLYVSMVNLSNEAIVIKNRAGIITTWNNGAARIFGYLSEEAIGKPVGLIIPEQSLGEEAFIMENILQGKTVHPYETTKLRKDGKKVIISVMESPIKDSSGKIIGASMIARDITEKKATDAMLVANEQKFRALVENDYSITSLLDAGFKTVYRSPSSDFILGWKDGDRKGKEVMEYVHPGDLSVVRSAVKTSSENPGVACHLLFRALKRTGDYIWLDGNIVNRLSDPAVNGYIVNLRDITEEKLAAEKLVANELRFRALIENISDAIVMNDEDSRILYQSPSVYKILGYTVEERENLNVDSYIHPDNKAEFKNLYAELRLHPGVPYPFEYRFRHKNGSYIWLEGVVTNLVHDPNVRAYIANYRDISERKANENAIRQWNAELEIKVATRTSELERVNKELEAFTYSVSHDLRAPLRIINGFSQILVEDYAGKLDEKGDKTIGVIIKNSKRMTQLIDDLLEFSRVGRTDMRMNPVNMNLLVTEVVAELENGGVRIPSHFTVEDLQDASGDGSLLKQVWSNLIANAIKYSSAKPDPVIRIGMVKDSLSPVYYIKDNGAGFDMEYAPKLFGVFQRLHRQEEFSGTGVGLALAQRIVARHGGLIWAEAAVNEGATFYFTLTPLVK